VTPLQAVRRPRSRDRFPKNFEREAEVHRWSAEMITVLRRSYQPLPAAYCCSCGCHGNRHRR
jgi:hypothetical protein